MMHRIIPLLLAFSYPALTAFAGHTEPADTLTEELEELVVTARQPATRLVGTSLISTIPGTNLEKLGTAIDVLRQLPMIEIADDKLSVIGKGEPEILIDGRPMHSPEELQFLQSTNIKRVELILAPGAEYSSDTKAVLKITTRHKFIEGLSIIDRAELDCRREVSADNYLDLNYRIGAWDIFAFGDMDYSNNVIKGTSTNTLNYDGNHTIIGSSQHKSIRSTTGIVKAGFNFSEGPLSFGSYYRYIPERSHFRNTGTEWFDDGTPVERNIYTENPSHTHLVSLYYDNTFRGKYHLHLDGDFRSSSASNESNTEYPQGQETDVSSADQRNSRLWAAKVYLNIPFAKGILSIGSQDSYTRTTLDFEMKTPEVSGYIPSTLTEASQTDIAAFATWKRDFGKLSLNAGLRYEYVDYLFKTNGIKDSDISKCNNLLTPDIALSFQVNPEAQVSLSYKMATVKPPYSHLTGSLNYVGLHEIEGGNPALRDEHMHDVQFFGLWKDFMLQADYTRSLDTYAFAKKIYPAPTLQLIMQPVNINLSALDIYFVWSKVIRSWRTNLTLGMHKQWLTLENEHYNRPLFSYYFDNTFTLPLDISATVNLSGQSTGYIHTNRFAGYLVSLDASIGKLFLNGSLQTKISATDILNTRNNSWTMHTNGIFVNKIQSYDRRGISLSVTYRFQARQSKYKGKAANEAESNRL